MTESRKAVGAPPRPLLYIIGPSGAGKSTALALALQGVTYEVIEQPIAFSRHDSGVVQLGKPRQGGFPGTDALPLNVQPKAVEFIMNTDAPAVIAEGDRLANTGFFQAAMDAGFALTIAYFRLSLDDSRARCRKRGSRYNDSWIKGRHTKCERIARDWERAVWTLDAMQPAETLAERLRSHPAIKAARGER